MAAPKVDPVAQVGPAALSSSCGYCINAMHVLCPRSIARGYRSVSDRVICPCRSDEHTDQIAAGIAERST